MNNTNSVFIVKIMFVSYFLWPDQAELKSKKAAESFAASIEKFNRAGGDFEQKMSESAQVRVLWDLLRFTLRFTCFW